MRQTLLVALLLVAWIPWNSATWAQDSTHSNVRTVNGIWMYYQLRGAGPPLVLLHGFFGCGGSWDSLVPGLAAHYRLIIPGSPGSWTVEQSCS
jgi:hypothetical protein